jgi:hypothetical protein
MSSAFYLREAEAVFQDWDEYVCSSDINIMIELYNINKFFDFGMRLEQWSEERFVEYKEKCKEIPRVLGKFCNKISDANLEALYKATDRKNLITHFLREFHRKIQLTTVMFMGFQKV